MDHFQRAWKLIQPQLVPFCIYGFVGIFLSGCTFYIPMLNVIRELKTALDEGRVPDVKKAFNFDKIKDDFPMWGTLFGVQLAITLILMMIMTPFMIVSVLLGGGYEILMVLISMGAFFVIVLMSLLGTTLMFWAPWIYLNEQITPVNAIKASFFYGKTTVIPVFIHLLIIQFSTMIGAFFCYLPAFLALTIGLVASVYLYESHRTGVQKVLAEHQLLTSG